MLGSETESGFTQTAGVIETAELSEDLGVAGSICGFGEGLQPTITSRRNGKRRMVFLFQCAFFKREQLGITPEAEIRFH